MPYLIETWSWLAPRVLCETPHLGDLSRDNAIMPDIRAAQEHAKKTMAARRAQRRETVAIVTSPSGRARVMGTLADRLTLFDDAMLRVQTLGHSLRKR